MFINSTFFKLKTQDQNVRSTTKTVLRTTEIFFKHFLEPDAFCTIYQ